MSVVRFIFLIIVTGDPKITAIHIRKTCSSTFCTNKFARNVYPLILSSVIKSIYGNAQCKTLNDRIYFKQFHYNPLNFKFTRLGCFLRYT